MSKILVFIGRIRCHNESTFQNRFRLGSEAYRKTQTDGAVCLLTPGRGSYFRCFGQALTNHQGDIVGRRGALTEFGQC